MQGATRRDFLRLTLLGSLGLILFGGIGAFLRYIRPRQGVTFDEKLTAPTTLDAIQDGDVVRVPAGKFYLSRYKDPDTGQSLLLALSWKCSHLGCAVPWNPDESLAGYTGLFHCPCHESIYTRTGQNIAGPAPHPLDILPITLVGRKIVVETGKRTQRQRYDPAQATPLS
jgi:cytochrome b6-f complex iron-sulfur subunit